MSNDGWSFILKESTQHSLQIKADEILESPIWKTLPAVKNNKVHMLDYKTYLHYDPISILGQADLIADMLVKSAK